MIKITSGNLLEAGTEAVVNTVNTVGVMGKGIALMFKERFAGNYRVYRQSCRDHQLHTGKMLVVPTNELEGPRWVINFPTKQDWRQPSRLEWIKDGLQDLVRVLREQGIRSVALPPLGCGNGGLDWKRVRPLIEEAASLLPETEFIVFEPTDQYQNVAKRTGVEQLTVARALIAESVRRYWVLGFECTLLEIQKLAWFLERFTSLNELPDVLQLDFKANRYGPYSPRLVHLLDDLDGSYLSSDKRISDSGIMDTISFVQSKKIHVETFLRSPEARVYGSVLNDTDSLIDGFQSPLGMELLATVDWLLHKESCQPTIQALAKGLTTWPGGVEAGQRKRKLFDDRLLGIALERLTARPIPTEADM